MLKSGLIGAAVAGLLSAIPCVNVGCCLWGMAGGMLAAFMLSKETQEPYDLSRAALAGLFAGALGGLFSGLVSGALNLALNTNPFANVPPDAAKNLPEFLRGGGGGALVVVMMIAMFVFMLALFGALGGVIGGAVFKRPAETQSLPQ